MEKYKCIKCGEIFEVQSPLTEAFKCRSCGKINHIDQKK